MPLEEQLLCLNLCDLPVSCSQLKTLSPWSQRLLYKLAVQTRQPQKALEPLRQIHMKVICSQGTENMISCACKGRRHNNSQYLTHEKAQELLGPQPKKGSPPHSCSVSSSTLMRAVPLEHFGVTASRLESLLGPNPLVCHEGLTLSLLPGKW